MSSEQKNEKNASGAELIALHVKTLPALPGVYRMLDARGGVLYVGKAKNLKKRVVNYTKPDRNPVRIQRMIALTVGMEFTTTHTEAEALLLEANLIKQLKPRYNILLRDDKSFPYILITGDHDFPQVLKHRGGKDRKGEYFGPFASGLAVNETIDVLHKAFLLRNCSDNVFALRTRPCLQYQIKRCTAPCVGKVSRAEYARQVDMARQFLTGKSRDIQERFSAEMQKASMATDFERAAFWRDRIRALTQIQARQNIHVDGLDNTDVHVLWQDGGVSCVQVFFFRAGQNFGNRAYFPRHEKDEAPGDILSAFIAQFYASRPAPREIVVNIGVTGKSLIEEALKMRSGHKVSIILPLRGQKAEIAAMAVKNAKEALARRLSSEAAHMDMLEKMAKTFGLAAGPKRIEVYDNSHISGAHALGAMIVVTPDGFQKNAYRKFNMVPRAGGGDDFAMMREMIRRRFQSTTRSEDARHDQSMPDLLLVDGGQGQMEAVRQSLEELGLSALPVVGIAKGPDRNAGRERFFLPGQKPFSLPPDDPLLYFLQRIRDESHRFAITSHRGRRSRSLVENPLDSITGIGAKRKKALLLHFGSAKSVAEAGVADLQKVDGISKSVAEKIYGFFHSGEEG